LIRSTKRFLYDYVTFASPSGLPRCPEVSSSPLVVLLDGEREHQRQLFEEVAEEERPSRRRCSADDGSEPMPSSPSRALGRPRRLCEDVGVAFVAFVAVLDVFAVDAHLSPARPPSSAWRPTNTKRVTPCGLGGGDGAPEPRPLPLPLPPLPPMEVVGLSTMVASATDATSEGRRFRRDRSPEPNKERRLRSPPLLLTNILHAFPMCG